MMTDMATGQQEATEEQVQADLHEGCVLARLDATGELSCSEAASAVLS